MHVNTKAMAVNGLLAAFTVVMIYLSSAIETSSLFFIAAASFCVGIVIREWGMKYGLGFLVASLLLNLLLAPNKFYCITYAGMAVYILLSELLWRKIANTAEMKNRTAKLWIGKYVIFNLIYIPVVCFMPNLIFTQDVTQKIMILLVLAGEAALFVYDYAYRYFQGMVWGKLRMKLLK